MNTNYQKYKEIRDKTQEICKPLEVEDHLPQCFFDMSPPKWHLGHTTWFFENFLLKKYKPGYKLFHSKFLFLFNSYYETQGSHLIREERGSFSRPLLKTIYEYREYVDLQVKDCLNQIEFTSEIKNLLEMGLNHEQQHQELLYMDLKCILGLGPIKTAYAAQKLEVGKLSPLSYEYQDAALFEAGVNLDLEFFSYCNEKPAHKYYLQPHSIANRPISNGEYLEFIKDGAYENPLLWKSEAWDRIQKGEGQNPLYWYRFEGQYFEYTLHGEGEVDLNLPVTHLSFYEADAFAQWAGARLPTEYEMEALYQKHGPPSMEVLDFHPQFKKEAGSNFESLFGQSWQWTGSAYQPYPGYKKPEDFYGEYNEKFMVNQKVLKGGSWATPQGHFRVTYRNFFHPHQKWAYTGLRLAKNP